MSAACARPRGLAWRTQGLTFLPWTVLVAPGTLRLNFYPGHHGGDRRAGGGGRPYCDPNLPNSRLAPVGAGSLPRGAVDRPILYRGHSSSMLQHGTLLGKELAPVGCLPGSLSSVPPWLPGSVALKEDRVAGHPPSPTRSVSSALRLGASWPWPRGPPTCQPTPSASSTRANRVLQGS